MNKLEAKALYDKERYSAKKEVLNTQSMTYYKANKEKILETQRKLRVSEGVGVYKVTYPSGIYIGSGLIQHRRQDHLSGNTNIAKTLNEKAISFEVVCLKDTEGEVRAYEQKVIDWYSLAALLNTKNVFGRDYNGER